MRGPRRRRPIEEASPEGRVRQTTTELADSGRLALAELDADAVQEIRRRLLLLVEFERQTLELRLLAPPGVEVPTRLDLALRLGVHPSTAEKVERRLAVRVLASAKVRGRRQAPPSMSPRGVPGWNEGTGGGTEEGGNERSLVVPSSAPRRGEGVQ